jgi:hypothetical protein
MTALDLEQVGVVGGPVRPVPEADVEALERELGTRMPDGYREYVTRLGAGTLESFIRVWTPAQISSGLQVHRGLLAGFWHWGDEAREFDQEAGAGSIPVADTLTGDMVAFAPSRPDQLVILPRDSDSLIVRREGLLQTVEWILSSGVLVEPTGTRRFQPSDHPEPQPVPAPTVEAGPAPVGSATEVVRAFLSELLEVERWALSVASLSPLAPPQDEINNELVARTDAVHRRYLSAALAAAHRGSSVTVGDPPEHDRFTITEVRPGRAGRVVVETREGVDIISLRRYTLEPDGNGYRIVRITLLGTEFEPATAHGLGAWVRSLFGRSG